MVCLQNCIARLRSALVALTFFFLFTSKFRQLLRSVVLECSFGLELPTHCFRYWNCFYLLNQSDLSKVVQESPEEQSRVGLCAQRQRWQSWWVSRGGAGRARLFGVGLVSDPQQLWIQQPLSTAHHLTLHHFGFLKKWRLYSFILYKSNDNCSVTWAEPLFLFFRLINTLYDRLSNISCGNGKLKETGQINRELIAQLYLEITRFFAINRELLLRDPVQLFLFTFDNFFSSWYW